MAKDTAKSSNHVAIIMDGNGRWAQMRARPRLFGHHAGAKRVRDIVEACPDQGVKYLTIFAFSTENWKRTQTEVAGLMKLFRRYIQRDRQGNIVAWFKEFDDPRIMSRTTGQYYATLEAMATAESKDNDDAQHVPVPATELLHVPMPYGANPVYGKPQWSGSYLALRGTRDLEEENYRTVRDENIPSMMLLVSGGVLGTNAVSRLETSIKDQNGRKGLIIVEAVAASSGPTAASIAPKLSVERTKSEQTTDALFLKYEQRGEVKARLSRRMPESAWGIDIGKSRATTLAMQRFTEEQVYTPKREDLSEPINKRIFPTLQVLCWRYRVKSREPQDPQVLAEIVRIFSEANLLDPDEAREIIGKIFNKNLKSRTELWQLLPSRFITMLLQTKNLDIAEALLSGSSVKDIAKALEEASEAAEKSAAQKDGNIENGPSDAKRGAGKDTPTKDEPTADDAAAAPKKD